MNIPSKKEVRQLIRQRQEQQSGRKLTPFSRLIMSAVEELEEFQTARTVALYWSLAEEVETHEAVRRWSQSKQIVLPVMRGDELELAPFTGERDLVARNFNVYEPSSTQRIAPSEVDLLIIPGMAFDRQGGRLGHGKGFYDRLLKHSPGYKVGICYDFQLLDVVPTDVHDIPMDCVITHTADSSALFFVQNRLKKPIL